MLEVALVVFGAAVLFFLHGIHQSTRETATWTRRVHERLVDQLIFLLFRTSDPTKDDQRRRIEGIMKYLHLDDFDELAEPASAQRMSEGHPVVLLLWDVAREAYRGAQEIALGFGKWSELTQEKQDKVRDEFWYLFDQYLKLRLPGRAWLFEKADERDKAEWRRGDIPTEAGDVLLEVTGLNPEFVVPAYRVRVFERDGDQAGRPAGEFRSRTGAESVAVRLSQETRIIERRQDGMWAVTWDGRPRHLGDMGGTSA